MRGQVALEFIALVSVVAVILAIFSIVSFNEQRVLQRERVSAEGWLVCKTVALEANSAASIGDGFQHVFYLPEKLDYSRDYSLSVSGVERVVRAEWGFGSCSLPLVATSFVGSPAKGYNNISNSGGVIIFG